MQQAGNADAETIFRAIEPDDSDWIVICHQKRIYRVLLSLVKDADAAESLTQECFLRAYRKRESFRGESNLETWLVSIALDLARDWGRNRRWAFRRRILRAEQLDFVPVRDAGRSPEQAVLDSELLDAVHFVVDRLPEKQKAVFLLRFVEEMPLSEIATVMGQEIGTVKTHLYRALRAVRSACGR
jgi:RNA polymerase sigma-70 factor (ECF subfamily)